MILLVHFYRFTDIIELVGSIMKSVLSFIALSFLLQDSYGKFEIFPVFIYAHYFLIIFSRIYLTSSLIIIPAEINRGIFTPFTASCYGQCGEGEGDCNKDSDCLPGFICKGGGYLGLATDFCTAGK